MLELLAIDFVDNSLGHVIVKLTAKKLINETLIIIASKHGQTPIDLTKFMKIPLTTITNTAKVDVLWQNVSNIFFLGHFLLVTAGDVNTKQIDQSDDITLIFLKNHHNTKTAVKNIKAACNPLKIQDIIFGHRLTSERFDNPLTDTRCS
jgi:predicted AlkP superfamily pyrophosphatase or phosphodiesterase